MGKRPEDASQEEAEHQSDDPGILADDSSSDGFSEDLSDRGADGDGDLQDNDAGNEAGDSDLDAEFDADAAGFSSDEPHEAEERPAAAEGVDDGAAAAGHAASGDAGGNDHDTDSDLDLDADNPSSSGGDEEPGSSASEPDNDEAAAAAASGGNRSQQQAASFLEGGKSASFAKAFAKIMAKPAKAAAGAAAKDVILSESAGLAKRKAEVEADEAAARQAKKQRQDMHKRGHTKVPKKGEDPDHDVREKQLLKLATRGVVLLFNAVNKVQKQKREAEAAGTKGAKGKAAAAVSKAGFLAELKAKSRTVAAGAAAAREQLVPGGPGAAAAAAGRKQDSLQQQQQQHGGAGWEVLAEGFPGLTGGVKMKDWDKAAGSDEEMNGQALAGSDDDGDDSGGEGW